MSEREWSEQQKAVFNWFENGLGVNMLVRARAGTGKTTTIIHGADMAPEHRGLLAAFNKKIADELNGRVKNPNIEAKTLHSLGYSYISRYWDRVNVDGRRGYKMARNVMGLDAPDQMVTYAAKLASFGKNTLLTPTLEDLSDCAIERGLIPDEEWKKDGWDTFKLAGFALRAMMLACERDGTVDFDDMIFIPITKGWVKPRYDFVCIDECQDMNAIQIEMARRACSPDGRICVVGDDRQAIYGFRGADSNSLDRLKRELEAEELPLTVTYRCPQVIVAYAKKIVPDFVAAATAPIGRISECAFEAVPHHAAPGDFVLSRANAPLVGMCFQLLRAGIPAKIEGRDIGKSLLEVVKRLRRRGQNFDSIEDISKRLEIYEEAESDRILREAGTALHAAEVAIATLNDKCQTLRAIIKGISAPSELEQKLETLFADTKGAKNLVVCSSVHKAKGLETDTVFVMKDTLYPQKSNDAIEEKNIEYVAVTRAKSTLVWVNGRGP